MPRTHTLALSLFVAALGTTALASADAIMPPRDDCAPGAIGRSSHAGQWCTTTTCNVDADCAPFATQAQMFGTPERSYVCRAVDLCVRSETYQLGGRRRMDDPSANTGTREIATACTPSCDAPASCTHVNRCVRSDQLAPTGSTTSDTTRTTSNEATRPASGDTTRTTTRTTRSTTTSQESSDGCAISPAGSVGPALVVLGPLALLVLRAPRRRSRQSARRDSTRRLPPR